MEVNLIAVILVYMDSKGDRLLYRYPYQEQQQQQQQQQQQLAQSQQQQQSTVSLGDGSSSTTITTITSLPSSTITSTTTTTITYTNELLLPNATGAQQQQHQSNNILPVTTSSTTTTTITLNGEAAASTSSLSNLTTTTTATSNTNSNYNITTKKYNPYALTITDDIFQTTPQTTNKICIVKGKLQGLSDEVLSTLLAVKQQLCHQKFELKINDVRFVSHPTLIPRKERNNNNNNNNATSVGVSTDNNDLTNGENDNNNNKRNLDITESTNKIIAEIINNNNNNNNNNDSNNNAINEINNNNNDDNSQQLKIAPQQVLINVVFALHAQANYSIVKCYHELSKKLGLVLRVEEQRIGYLSEETLHMARTHDEVSTQQQPLERVFDLISERSSLAQAIKSIYHDLCTTGLISLTLNQTKTLAFCMPQKAHQLHKKGSLVDPNTIRSCLRSLKPYHGMLLLVDFAELLDCVPPPAVRMLLQLIEVYTPLLSLQNMASDADILIENVYKIVSHLVYWAKATIIYPLCETNVYVIAPDAPLHTKSHLVDKFASRFAGMSLFEAIADFSLPTSIGHLTTPLQQPARQGILVQMVLWMLQHHLIIQLHTYVQFMTCPNDTHVPQNQGSETRRLLENLHIDDINALATATVITSSNTAPTTAAEQRNLLRPLSLMQLDNDVTVNYNGKVLNSCNLDEDDVDDDINDDDDDDDNNNNINNNMMRATSLLSMPSQPLPVPAHAVRHSITETEAAYSAGGSTVSDNIAAMPSSSHKSNYSMTASVSTENCESIDSIEDEEKIKELLQLFDEIDSMAIRRIPASNNLDDLTLLVKLYQAGYFKSEHHLEEIMYFENLRRSQLLQLLDKFRDVLIIYETEDPAISSMYSNK